MQSNHSLIKPANPPFDILSSRGQPVSQPIAKTVEQASVCSSTHKHNHTLASQRRMNPLTLHHDFHTQRKSPSSSVPLLIDTTNNFFQATQSMEEEIMLPLRLKDMPVEELVFDGTSQPDNWYDVYTFIRDIRNQLQRTHPFLEDNYDNNNSDSINSSHQQQRKHSCDDEGIIILSHDNNQFSSASSSVSSDDLDRISTSSQATSYDSIQDELKCHYYGLLRVLDHLTLIANRVAERYREQSLF